MNKLVYPKCGLPLPYPELGSGRTVGMLSPPHPASFPRQTLGGSSPGTMGYTPALYQNPHGIVQMSRSTTDSTIQRRSTENIGMDRHGEEWTIIEGRKNDGSLRKYRRQSVEKDRNDKKTNGMDEIRNESPAQKETDQKNKGKMKEGRSNETHPSNATIRTEVTKDRSEEGMTKDRLKVEVRAATDIRTGVILGPYPEPFFLGMDLLDEGGDNTTPDRTVWVSNYELSSDIFLILSRCKKQLQDANCQASQIVDQSKCD